MSPKSKMGRPKIPKADRKKPFAIRFTDAQVAAFERAAKTKGLTVRDWMDSTLTDASK